MDLAGLLQSVGLDEQRWLLLWARLDAIDQRLERIERTQEAMPASVAAAIPQPSPCRFVAPVREPYP